MTTFAPPYALAQVSLNGGAAVLGGVALPPLATVALTGVNTTNWSTALWEIYDSPPGWTAPAGWSTSPVGVIYYSGTNVSPNPPQWTAPAISGWGKWGLRLTVNQGTDPTGAFNPTRMIDTSLALDMVSQHGLHDGMALEASQFGFATPTQPAEAWAFHYKADLRILEAFMASGGGGGGGWPGTPVAKSSNFVAVANTFYLLTGTLTMTIPTLTNGQWVGFLDILGTATITVTPPGTVRLEDPTTIGGNPYHLAAGANYLNADAGGGTTWIFGDATHYAVLP